MGSDQVKNQHLLWRAGFGPAAHQFTQVRQQSPKKLFCAVLEASQKDPVLFDLADPGLRSMVMAAGESQFPRRRNLSPGERKNIRTQSVQDIRALNVRWLGEMTDSDAQLREKMSLFWHGHFASKTINIFYDQQLLNVIRQHALGNFRDLLFNVSKSASMIRFLNNNQNKKDHPNENFARELMELFTIGRGNYSEQDVKESARAFTGWGTSLQGDFEFRERQHDDGEKSFLGKMGKLSGEDILDMLLSKKQTAVFITRKIYRFFVNDQADENRVFSLAEAFYKSGYDIQKLMEAIFSSDWFYDEKNIGTHIKSPVEWMVGIRRQLPQDIENPEVQVLIQRLLGQVLFNPPNVAGWPGGKHWIDSSSLMFRMRFPQIMYAADAILATPKDDDDLMMGSGRMDIQRRKEMGRAVQFIHTRIRWSAITDHFRDSEGDVLTDIRQWLLPCNTAISDDSLKNYLDQSSQNSLIQSAVIRFMSTPEYQLC
ncbi:MAG: DUF1800 domain-containing protein [Bacteroidota bacterium]|nr:DUF1800 domain-containing protein [Bacteroidota bacterium]MDP4211593.1 DUF1800 domain-containing protein [Bacteroidota bacterium]MDP4249100.1 DUF1800 domain-containing protein [Bacteroidota bacterium]